MLRQLHIGGLGVIEDLDLELHPGLNVLTGETGAGKTMVTVGLALALGARAGSALVREGSSAARVQARFDAPTDAEEWVEDGELLLARTVSADGKSTARIGGQLATASSLADMGSALVEVHGQHQAQRLLVPAAQTAFLDRFAGEAQLVALSAYRETYDRWQSTRAELAELTEASREREREIDLLGYQVREIEAIGPQPGETAALEAEQARLSHVERLLEQAAVAEDALAGEPSLVDDASVVASALEDAARHDDAADELARRARGLAAEIAELARDTRAYRESLTANPARLQEVRERLSALGGLRRKYGSTEEDVLAFLGATMARLEVLATADERLEALATQAEGLMDAVRGDGALLTSGRAAAAPALARAVEEELHELGMPAATVEVALTPSPGPGPTGYERAELGLSASPGQKVAPLAKAASGGELSRTMLACRSVLADLDDIPTLVFDEVDAGIGGEAGLAVGRRLASLAQGRQVLVVTHLPQIACFADRHVFVDKRDGTATVRVLDDDERIRELSRMLAGLTGSDGAVTHAEELLAAASATRTR